MIPGLDSAYPPSALSISAARGAGVRVWAGYFAGPNIYNGWAQSAFHQVQTGGLGTFAYCSGYSDPAQMRSQSLTWGVPICLDVEGGIRPDGAWVQGWLDAAAAGLYGNAGVHKNRTAAFHVVAAYPGSDPHATWPAFLPRPASPCGWQWQGTHRAFGASVDSSWLDDDLLGLSGDNPSHSEDEMNPDWEAFNLYVKYLGRVPVNGEEKVWADKIRANLGGDVLGHVLGDAGGAGTGLLSQPECKAWMAKLEWLRTHDLSLLQGTELVPHTHPTSQFTVPANSTGAAVKS